MATLGELSQQLRDLVPVFEELHRTPQGDALVDAADRLAALEALMPRLERAATTGDDSDSRSIAVCASLIRRDGVTRR